MTIGREGGKMCDRGTINIYTYYKQEKIMKKTKKLLAFVLAFAMLATMVAAGMAFAADGEITLAAADAVCTGKALGRNDTAFNERNGNIANIGPDSTITYTVPEDVEGSYDIYLEVGKASFMAWGSTPFYVSINGDKYTTPIIQYLARSTTVNAYGTFALRTGVELKGGDQITIIGVNGFEMNGRMSMMPTVRDIKLYPAGTEVAIGYNNEIPVKEEADPSDPLSGRTILWLGSSVTYGQQASGYSMADLIAETHPATNCPKYAISGTTLVDETSSSYVSRMKHIDKDIDADLFIVQLSTNDATNNKPLGELAEGFDKDTFDTKTIYGAMEYIIAYAKETWGCPVMFYSGSYYESEAYGKMVEAMHAVQEKWGIECVDLYCVDEMTEMYNNDQWKAYMADGIHPRKIGYVEWWGPYFEESLTNAMIGDDQYVVIDDVTTRHGEIATTEISIKNNEAGISSYRMKLKVDLDLDIEITSDYEMECNKKDDGYYLIVYSADGSLIKGDTVLFTVTIDMTEDIFPDGEYPLDLIFVDSTTVDDVQTAPYALDGVLIIDNNYPIGDVTKDFEITNADLIMIARYLVDLVEFDEKQMIAADFNQDGTVDNKDLVLIARAIVAA